MRKQKRGGQGGGGRRGGGRGKGETKFVIIESWECKQMTEKGAENL